MYACVHFIIQYILFCMQKLRQEEEGEEEVKTGTRVLLQLHYSHVSSTTLVCVLYDVSSTTLVCVLYDVSSTTLVCVLYDVSSTILVCVLYVLCHTSHSHATLWMLGPSSCIASLPFYCSISHARFPYHA